ncbi:MAG: YbhB/YbcL family Raf kinase inhibitor-like protein [Gammaproteobacteria bacterium]|nr:YbhB/YbcL family Raf kinase inhibitor-like protein [Gammaproteobacteria bacterium]
MKITTTAFEHGQPIPEQFAFCKYDASDHVAMSNNLNPDLAWSDVPDGTKSFVLVCVDPDVPTKPDDVNQEDREVPEDLPRMDFHHWLMVDIPADVTSIAAGSCCDGITPHGKHDPEGPAGSRQGINNYTDWFAGDKDMEGQYFGYDGPCPPWNDSIIHHYHFRIYATDFERCPVEGAFTGQDLMQALEGHVLGVAEVMGTYTLNPRLR